MNKIRVKVSVGTFKRIEQNQYSTVKLHYKVVTSVNDLLLIESEIKESMLQTDTVLVREVIDIDFADYLYEGSDFYDVLVRNNNYLS